MRAESEHQWIKESDDILTLPKNVGNMSEIIFQEINQEIEKQIAEIWGDWVIKYGCLHYGDGCYSLAALCDGKPVGFISAYPLQFPEPLQMFRDAYIDDIEYDGKFLRRSKTIIFPRNCCSEHSPTDGIGFLWERQNDSIGCVVKKPE